MDVRIGITQSMREIELELAEDVSRESLKADIAAALGRIGPVDPTPTVERMGLTGPGLGSPSPRPGRAPVRRGGR